MVRVSGGPALDEREIRAPGGEYVLGGSEPFVESGTRMALQEDGLPRRPENLEERVVLHLPASHLKDVGVHERVVPGALFIVEDLDDGLEPVAPRGNAEGFEKLSLHAEALPRVRPRPEQPAPKMGRARLRYVGRDRFNLKLAFC